MPTNYP